MTVPCHFWHILEHGHFPCASFGAHSDSILFILKTAICDRARYRKREMKFILEKSKYLALIGVVALMLATFAAFAWGTLKTIDTIVLVVSSMGMDKAIIVKLIEIVV